MKIFDKGIFSDYLNKFDERDADRKYVSHVIHSVIANRDPSDKIDLAIANLGLPVAKSQRRLLKKEGKKMSRKAKKKASDDIDYYEPEHKNILNKIFKTQSYITRSHDDNILRIKILDNNSLAARIASAPGNGNFGSSDFFLLLDRKLIDLWDLLAVFISACVIFDRAESKLGIPSLKTLLLENREVFKFYSASIRQLAENSKYYQNNPRGLLSIRRQIYECCAVYCFAHEISHVILGHLDEGRQVINELEDEIEAETLTSDIMKEYGDLFDNTFCQFGIGAILVLNGISHIDAAAGITPIISDTHPSREERIKIIVERINKNTGNQISHFSILQIGFLRLMLQITPMIDEIRRTVLELSKIQEDNPGIDLKSYLSKIDDKDTLDSPE